MIRRVRKLVSVLLLGSLVLFSPSASAVPRGITVSPAVQEIMLEKDQDETKLSFFITNNTESTVSLRLSTQDFGSLDESGGIAFLGRTEQETTVYGLKQWLLLEKDTLTLAPGAKEEIHATIPNKESLAPGGHYGAVIVTAEQEAGGNSQSVQVLPATSVLVLLKKIGGETYDLKLNKAEFGHSLVTLPSTIRLRVQNSGNIHVVPRGTVNLYDPFGRHISKGIINTDSSFVLPQSFRQLPVSFSSLGKAWLPGRYKLEVQYRHDSTGDVTTQTFYIWYTGLLVLLLLITLFLFIVLVLFVKFRRSLRAANTR